MNEKLKGSLCLLLCPTIWGASFVAQSVGMDHLPPFAFQSIRCFLAILGLLPLIGIADRKRRDGKTFLSRWKDPALWKAALLCGLPLFLATNLQLIGIRDTDAGKAAFLSSMYIVLVPIIDCFLGKKLSPLVPVSVVIAALGSYLLSCAGVPRIRLSDLLLLGSALMYALQIAFIDRFANQVDAFRLNALQALLVALGSGIVTLLTEETTWQSVVNCWLPLFYAGFLSMGLAFSMQIIGQRAVAPTAAALIMSLESVLAAVFGWLILKETMTPVETLGSILVFSAVILSQFPLPERKSAA